MTQDIIVSISAIVVLLTNLLGLMDRAIQRHRDRKADDKSTSFHAKATCSADETTHTTAMRRSMRRSRVSTLVVGLGSLLLALANLSLYVFGPAHSQPLTAGAAASIAVSALLGLSGMQVLRS